MKEILELEPILIEKMWGEKYEDVSDKRIGEIILLSGDNESNTILNGSWKNKKFVEYIKQSKIEKLGKKYDLENGFTLQIKIINAIENLSLQVHAKEEFWYILDAEKDSCLYLGLKKFLSIAQIEEKCKNSTIMNDMRKYKIKRGDCIRVPKGTIHAIGGGIKVLEVKEICKTYRLYDFGRKRSLDLNEALNYVDVTRNRFMCNRNVDNKIASINKYNIHLLHIEQEKVFKINEDSCWIIFCVSGFIQLRSKIGQVELIENTLKFIPANFGKSQIQGIADLLIVKF